MERDILKFAAARRVVLMFKHGLEVVEEIKLQHDENVERLSNSLKDLEIFIKETHGIDINLSHLTHHVNFLTKERADFFRKKILDYGNALKREIEEQ